MTKQVDIVKYGWQKRGSFIVDDCDYDRVNNKKWSMSKNNVISTSGKISLKRFILGISKGSFNTGSYVIYKNGNKMDNRRSNLMIVKSNKWGKMKRGPKAPLSR